VLFVTIAAMLLSSLYRNCPRPSKRMLILGYLGIALYMGLPAAVLLRDPSTYMHVHHAQVGLLIVPLTIVPTPIAFFVQALALGLFINGYAAWGWPPFVETSRTYLYLSIYLSFFLSIYLSIYHSIYLSIYLSRSI
jgi:hypothetical protein